MLPLESGVTVAEKKTSLTTAVQFLLIYFGKSQNERKEQSIFYICSKMTDP